MYNPASRVVCYEIYIKNFRCFESITLAFNHPVVVLEGLNGAGKTSLLEALYYACYLRSFRTHMPKELIRFEQDTFFVRVKIRDNDNDHEIQVGFSQDKRSVKVDKKAISSYKELMAHYRVVSLIEDDLHLITGGPDERRAFIDQTLLLLDASFAGLMKEFRKIVSNRSSLIQQIYGVNDNYLLWTRQLWEKSQEIQKRRKELLFQLLQDVQVLVKTYFNDMYSISCVYETKLIKQNQSYDQFLKDNRSLFDNERAVGRSLFGAHLDDFVIKLENRKTKRLVSRGQQKLILLLLKIAQARHIVAHKGPILFLLDDFMADFDAVAAQALLSILYSLDNSQLIFTTPAPDSLLAHYTRQMGAQEILVSVQGGANSIK